MKKNYIFYVVLIIMIFTSCEFGSNAKDLEPIINGKFKEAKSIYYPSTNYKVSAIIIDKNGDVWFLRMNGLGQMRDEKKMFNVSDYNNSH